MAPVVEHQGISELTESAHAREVRDAVAGPSRGSVAPPNPANAELVTTINILQGTVATLMAIMAEKQSTAPYPTVAPAMVNAPLVPQALPPSPPPVEMVTREVKIYEFLKLKSSVFSGEDSNEDPQWFLDGIEKACKAFKCSNACQVELGAY